MKGVVVCPQPCAADVGAAILAKGGNAFDAAVAAVFSQMVNDPCRRLRCCHAGLLGGFCPDCGLDAHAARHLYGRSADDFQP
jgi:hypothetical protein